MPGPDMSPLLTALVPSISSVLYLVAAICFSIAGFIVAYIFAGDLMKTFLGKLDDLHNDQLYKSRYLREQRNRQYRQWKKKKGYF